MRKHSEGICNNIQWRISPILVCDSSCSPTECMASEVCLYSNLFKFFNHFIGNVRFVWTAESHMMGDIDYFNIISNGII